MKVAPALFAAWLLLALLLLPGADDQAEALPGRRKGGGWGKKISSGLGFGSKKKYGNNYGSNYGSSSKGIAGTMKKGSKMKTLKKAAVIGAVAYGGYQLGKLSGRFGGWGYGHQHGYGFNDWNRWREIDGFMCRNNDDCKWMDARLYCQDYEMDFQPSALWFGSPEQAARIVGECACPHGMVWNDREMECFNTGNFGGIAAGVAAVIGIAVIVLLCCCGCAVFFVLRKFF